MLRRSFFPILQRWCLLAAPGSQNCRAIQFGLFDISRCFSSPTAPTSDNVGLAVEEEESSSTPAEAPDDLRSRIFRLRFPKRSATAVIEKWVAEGRKATAPELRKIAWDLRRSQRFKHALEISEWMKSHQESELSDDDYAMRIDLITKVFGISSAEEFFEGLPSTAKSCEVYTALLHSYARTKLIEKAEKLFERIKNSNLSVSILTFNEMMTLYASVGQLDKVHIVVEELKRRKVSPDLFTYNLWISACAATLDIEGVREILNEMASNSSSDDRWTTYTKLTDIYITAGRLVSSDNSLIEEEKKISRREWITYDFLILLHAGLGNIHKINEIWKALRMTSQKMTSRNYICGSYSPTKKKKRMGQHYLSIYPLMQIYIWMESRSSFQTSAADEAAKIDLIIKVDSIVNAELHFEQISNLASQKAASLPLLHSYVKERELGKAEALLAKLCNLGFIVNPHPFNEIMKLYAAIGQFKKVIYVIRHMRRNKVPLNVLSYNLWMNACGEVSDIASLEMIYKEMMGDKNVEAGWSTYCTLANIYNRSGLVDKAFTSLRIAETKLSVKKRLGYSFVMTIYAALGDKEGVLRLWDSSKRLAGKIPCASYMSVMSCLVKLGDISETERIFREWESQCWKYDIRVPNILLGAHMRNGCMDKVELLFFHTLKKSANPNYKTWEILMEGWVKNKKMDKAVEAMKKGLSMLKHCIWRPPSAILSAIAEYYEETQNVDDAKKFVKVLQRSSLMNLCLYKSFVRMHIKARRANPNILKMMARDGIEPDEEIRLLINQTDTINSLNIC